MSVIVAPGNCLTFTNSFWDLFHLIWSHLLPGMVPSGYLFGVSLDGRLSSSLTGVTEIGVFSSGFSGIASLFCLLFKYLE